MKPARFFMLDARAAWPVLVMLLHMRIYTMIFAVLVMVLFYVLEQRGLSFFSALRAFRVWLVTRKRPNYRHSDLTRMVDFAYEPIPERFLNEKPKDKSAKPTVAESRAAPPSAKSSAYESVPKGASITDMPTPKN